jgi:catechol 2,3-dioxygenase-like lactoylglutathione lyase family enzyme
VSGGAAESGSARRRRRRHSRTVEIAGLDHVQMGMPAGEETLARWFYGGVLGLQEVRKVRALAGRGGAWFVGPGLALHLGVEEPFRPATRAHPAFRVESLERARSRLTQHGIPVIEDDARTELRRLWVADPFGNRIELIDARDGGFTERRRRRPSGPDD